MPMQQKFMLEDIERLLERIKRNTDYQKLMEYWYIEGVLSDMKFTFGKQDVTRETMRHFYGQTFIRIWNTWS